VLREWIAKRRLRRYLANCDLASAREILIGRFSGSVIAKELGAVLDSFVSNPSVDTALDLLAFDPEFIIVFDLAAEGGLSDPLPKRVTPTDR
jgi:hypothetical protein